MNNKKILINVWLRKVGAKSNPSFVIPVKKEFIKDNKININKKVRVSISQTH